MYTVLGILFLFLVRREIEQGPEADGGHGLLGLPNQQQSATVPAALVGASSSKHDVED